MTIARNTLDLSKFNRNVQLPYELRLEDFSLAVQDVYDFFFDVNTACRSKVWSGSMTHCDPPSCRACCPTC